MSSRLEQFIREHRDEFDTDEPSAKVWDQIRGNTEPGSATTGPVIRLGWVRWSAAAAVLFLAIAGIWYISRSHAVKTPADYAGSNKPASAEQPAATQEASRHPDTVSTKQTEPQNLVAGQHSEKVEPGHEEAENGNEINEEMYHYAKIVELKQKELKKIEKDEPLLYKQFAGDVNKLDSVYRSLKKELDVNPNREQLLEAMIRNLQLQMDLLNHQLEIIKQINHSKKSAYEKAYKSV